MHLHLRLCCHVVSAIILHILPSDTAAYPPMAVLMFEKTALFHRG